MESPIKFTEAWWKQNHPNITDLSDLSKIWKCTLCDWQIETKEPVIIGMICCGNCGMSTLRPIHDLEEQNLDGIC